MCDDCGKDYVRDFRTRSKESTRFEHLTGRHCDCGSELRDTIINFGESLPKEAIQRASHHAKKADLCLSLGSSLQVRPAMLFPLQVSKVGTLAIVNL